MEQPRTVAELRDAVVAEWEVDAPTAERDLLDLLAELADRGLAESFPRSDAKRAPAGGLPAAAGGPLPPGPPPPLRGRRGERLRSSPRPALRTGSIA